MAAPALNLDLTGIAIGQPRVPDPIYNAFSAIQTTLNSLGNVHMAADMALATSKLAGGKTARTLRIDPAAFNQGSNTTSVLTVTYHPAVRYQDAVNAYALAGGIRMPADWDGTNFTLRIRGSVDGASVGVVAMAVNILRQQSGLTLVSTFTQSATLNPTAATTNVPFDATSRAFQSFHRFADIRLFRALNVTAHDATTRDD